MSNQVWRASRVESSARTASRQAVETQHIPALLSSSYTDAEVTHRSLSPTKPLQEKLVVTRDNLRPTKTACAEESCAAPLRAVLRTTLQGEQQTRAGKSRVS